MSAAGGESLIDSQPGAQGSVATRLQGAVPLERDEPLPSSSRVGDRGVNPGVDPARTAIDHEVRASLQSYQDAYAGLDAISAREIWPDVDERSLRRAFSGLTSQRLEFEPCQIDVHGTTATAACVGHTVNEREHAAARSDARRWVFRLRQDEGHWLIDQTEVH
jgi:hypothetical protein